MLFGAADVHSGRLSGHHPRKLAAQIGASREAVSRALKKLEDAGCFTLTCGCIETAGRARLQAEA
ncbi:MAG: hypothetical protein B7Y50_09345 [Hydrogenophilales bacterium 28-61-11]|nr:MAG: hypothetical protein B7Y50_09345 [Hydrogenophilales bacterium 28-61-11]OYZ56467.1 MAG: hypothetical protein B7Y21_11510 [Hydrogenophilales bacterium 16-61-112]OZA45316.1 MAG: hypothetical protein B7X81_08565 [Hydrogenophilales bacterium 17-61-76]